MFNRQAQVNIIDVDPASIWIDCCAHGRYWKEHGFPTSSNAIRRAMEILDLADAIDSLNKHLPVPSQVAYFHDCVNQSRPPFIGTTQDA